MQASTATTNAHSPSQQASLKVRILGNLPEAPCIFFAEDARLPGASMMSVRLGLSELAKEGSIIRLAWGVYARPALEEYSMKRIIPSPEQVAHAVAERGRLLIVPCGAQAARRVGLAEESLEGNLEWFSNGAPREIHLSSGRTIRFIMTKESRIFGFKDDRMRDLSNGIRFIGKDKMGSFERDAVRLFLKGIPEEVYNADFRCCPEWVREILEECRGKESLGRELKSAERGKRKTAAMEG